MQIGLTDTILHLHGLGNAVQLGHSKMFVCESQPPTRFMKGLQSSCERWVIPPKLAGSFQARISHSSRGLSHRCKPNIPQR